MYGNSCVLPVFPVIGRGHAGKALKGGGENALTGETAVQGDFTHGLTSLLQHVFCGPDFEIEAVFVRCHTGVTPEHPEQMVGTDHGDFRERLKVRILFEMGVDIGDDGIGTVPVLQRMSCDLSKLLEIAEYVIDIA